jgi:hypothetical protein
MIITSQHNNTISLSLADEEVIYFRGVLLRGRSFGIPWFPPYPLGSPIARLLAGCYFLNRASRRADQPLLQLNGDSGLGRFQVITLTAEDRYFVHPRYLAAFSFTAGGGLHTQLSRLLSPSCWGIHHPLPVVAQGPGQLVVYAEHLYCSATPREPSDLEAGAPGADTTPVSGKRPDDAAAGALVGTAVEAAARDISSARLRESQTQSEYIPSQVVAFDCRQPFRVRALHPDHSPLSQVVNALIDDNRICFNAGAQVYISPINHPNRHQLRVFLHVLFHLALIPAILYVLAH